MLALDLLNYADSGTVPPVRSGEEQRRVLQPLVEFLKLEGWTITEARDAAYTVSIGGSVHTIACYPSVRDINESLAAAPSVLNFSEYEIANALPDAAARVSR
jgi:hypothetical protein